MSSRGLKPGGFWSWLFRTTPRPKTPPVELVVLDRPIQLSHEEDSAAIAALSGHPGVTALLNRFRLQQALLEAKLRKDTFEDINDVRSIQLGISWIGYVESEIRFATQTYEGKHKPRVATFDDLYEFEKIKNAIESVGHTKN